MTTPKPPSHLSLPTKRWWQAVIRDYALEEHHVRLLTLAATAWDVGQIAREALEKAGALTYQDRFGQPKPRPEVAMQRDAMITFSRLLRELDLDVEPPGAAGRPPALRSIGG